ncbi:uncharacterized protein LOC133201405 [Saccostrea echinata]|uniref:uncharacterized protein LOC133201405 n=1 Tax=Saccostrea echinata TaxID=191078 RepID=UPI002A8306DC|nr:uncharacterized protein LOC133201405 [Saccostrea echinata]
MDPHTSAQDVMRCDLCETAVVQMHCDTCFVNLCKACVGEHISADLSKPHKIVDFKDRKSTPLYPGCTTHFKERCQMYCKQCVISVCTKCIVSDEHLGHKLSEIGQIIDEKRNSIVQEQTELNEAIYPTYKGIASDVQNRMSQLEKKFEDLSASITKHGEVWHIEIDIIVKNLKAVVDKLKNKQLETLQKQLNETEQKISKIGEEIKLLENAIDSKDISKLLSFKSNLDEYRELPQKIMPSLPVFSPKRIQGDQIRKLFGVLTSHSLTSDKHGYSLKINQKSTEAGSSPPVKRLLDKPETVTTIDTGYRTSLYNVACQCDEQIWTSGDDNTMKLFSINLSSVLKSIRTNLSPFFQADIAVTKSGDLVYTDHNDRTVNIVKNEKTEKVIRQLKLKPDGICSTFSGDLLVIMNSGDYKESIVVRFSGSTEKQTIQFDDTGKPIYSSGFYHRHIIENRNLDICVADSKAVVVVNQAGKMRFRYTGHNPAPKNNPFSPRGITTDSQSHILTADYYNDCVHIIDQDGQFLRYIDCGLSNPHGLCTDANDNLFVAECTNKQVKKIKYM